MRQKAIRVYFLFTTLLFTGQGCGDFHYPMYNYQSIWKCHYENTWSYETTKNKIVGIWEWKYIICCGETSKPYQNHTESRGLKIEFKADGTGTLMGRDTVREFTWDIEIKDNDLYGFQSTSPISPLYGRLLFCDNIMMCNDSYIDGADNFFKKVGTSGN